MDARAPCFEVLGFQLGRARGATRAKRAALGLKVARFPLATARHGPANLPPCVVARARVVPSIAEGIFLSPALASIARFDLVTFFESGRDGGEMKRFDVISLG